MNAAELQSFITHCMTSKVTEYHIHSLLSIEVLII